jgi:hypothetical protein
MIPFNPRPPVAAFWNPNSGAWMPRARRVAPPKRWLRYPLTILLASAIWFGAGHLTPWGEATGPITRLGPCHKGAAIVALPLFAATEGERDDQ